MYFWAAFFLAFAVSLDGFTVGITYGLKNIEIKFVSLFIISLASGITMLVSLTLGNFLTLFLQPQWAERIGAVILIFIGFYLFYQSFKIFLEEAIDYQDDINIKDLYTIEIESLGLIINILKQPVKADLDYSGVISKREAIILGIALAMDAFGGGIGAGLAGYSPVITSISTFLWKFVLLKTGIYLGRNVKIEEFGNKFKLIPGLILVVLGIIQFI